MRCLGVEIPAVVVDGCCVAGRALGALFAISDEGADFGGGLVFKVHEPDDDVGNLHAGVVDVVLHVDFLAGGAEKVDKGVAKDGVAQMAHMRGLVGIDAGVLHRVKRGLGRAVGAICGDEANAGVAVEARIDIAGAGDFKSDKALKGAEGGNDFLGDDFGGLAQGACQLQSDGRGQLTELELGGNFNGDGFRREIVLLLQYGAEMCFELLL